MKWHYEEAQLNGGAGGEAFKSSFNGTGKKPAAILAREAVQNSVDARLDRDTQVRVDFRFRLLSGSDRSRTLKDAGMNEMKEFIAHLGCASPNCLTKEDVELELLYIDDYETTGLKGDPTKPSSNLRKLLMELGGSLKVGEPTDLHTRDEAATGGSYGFGKAVYSSNSRLGTIFAFSRTEDQNGRPISVLMGCAYQAGHQRGDREYTGRAWFGVPTEVPGRGVRYDPFVGEDAERLAASLGFERDDGTGTSILIVDTSLHAEDLIAGLEDYWWPRIQKRLLDASVYTSDGIEHHPTPRQREHLKPFMDAFDIALGSAPHISGKSARQEFQRMSLEGEQNHEGIYGIGLFAALIIADEPTHEPFEEEHEQKLDSVALIRGPLMVVDYYKNWNIRASVPPAVGCFYAHSDIDEILKLSEPPEHDRWDPESQRLARRSPAYQDLVRSVLKRLKRRFTDFQKSAKPLDAKAHRPLRRLERTLAQWFGPGKPENPHPEPNPAPVSLRPKINIHETEGYLEASGQIHVSLSKQALEKGTREVQIRMRIILKVQEEDGVSAADPVPIIVDPGESGLRRVIEERPGAPDIEYWLGTLTGANVLKVNFVSEPYDPSWTIQLVPQVEEWREGEAA